MSLSNKDMSEPAFPSDSNEFGAVLCMSLRDYFAAKAMQASRSRNSSYASWKDLAVDAYEIADAMLMERSK